MAKTRERKLAEPRADRDGWRGMPDISIVKVSTVLAATALGLYLCYRLSLPFLPALTWALVLAILLAPIHRQVEKRVGRPDLSALVSVAATAIVVGVPLFLMVQQLAREAIDGVVYLQNALGTFDWREVVAQRPWLSDAAAWIEQRFDLPSALRGFGQWLTEHSTTLFRGSLNQVISLVLTFYVLFYVLRDRRDALRGMVAFSPLTTTETMRVAHRFAETVRATILGTVVVGLVQGALGGLMFWWLGLPTPVFWGLVMGVLAIVPVLGAFVIWVPAAAILALQGEWASAALLALWGGVIIATIDNLLYPVLVGNRLKLHTLAAFVGTVGGIILFGAAGLVLGPAVIAVTVELMKILRKRTDRTAPAPTGER